MTLESSKKWNVPDTHSKGNLINKLLELRGVDEKQKDSFLNPSLKDLPDPTLLHGAKEASIQIIKAVKDSKKIFIHGDFDADGICATAILWEYIYKDLREVLDTEVDCIPYIPDRVDEGYGLSKKSVDNMISQGADLIITVDCGIRDKDLINDYMQSHPDTTFIVTDHHQPPEDIAEDLNYTIVHQMFPGSEFPEQHISGATVAWLLTHNMRLELGLENDTESLLKGIDLVGLSTVTDIMPLTGMNRILVHIGLEQMRKGVRVGVNTLAKVAKVNPKELDAYHLGFVIGPRINAAGRIGSPLEALKLFLSSNSTQALKRAGKLDALNTKRQQMTTDIIKEARKQIEESGDNLLNFLHGEGWAEGIVGLVAGKIQEEFGKPTIIVTVNDNEARGSARSFGGLNITEAIEQFADILIKYGGHAQAAGFSLKPDNLDKFKIKLQKYVNDNFTEEDFVQELKIDLIVDTADLTLDTLEQLDALKPYGYGNKSPVLMMEKMVVVNKFPMGRDQSHLKLSLKGNDFGFTDAVMFRCKEDIDKIQIDDVLDLVGNLSLNEWNGNKSIQFIVKEWRKSEL